MHRITGFLKNTVASVTALTVFLMFVFVGLLALVIDLGHIHAIKNELQNAADSGALAGARGLYHL
jgi:Flp pilus assembly protein TadG